MYSAKYSVLQWERSSRICQAASDVILLHAVAAYVRLHQRVLRPQVADAEHEVVGAVDAASAVQGGARLATQVVTLNPQPSTLDPGP